MTPDEVAALFAKSDALRAQLDAETAHVKAQLVTPPVVEPTALPTRRLVATDVVHARTFRLPRDISNGQSFDGGGGPIAFDPTSTTLFAMSRNGCVAEISIPSADGSFAAYVQGFVEPSEGKIAAALTGANGNSTPGLLVVNGQLVGDAIEYYDAGNVQRVGHYTRPRDLSDRGHVSDLVPVWAADKEGYVAGPMAHVPPEWQAALKGTIITSEFGEPIVSREPRGPDAFSLTLPLVSPLTPATPLCYYPSDHPTLGLWEATAPNPIYGSTAVGGGLALIDGTCSALYFGRIGTGVQSYGNGVSDPALAGTIGADGEICVYDPASSDKGQHAWPYTYLVWAYDLHDFVAVVTGSKQPWEVVPYATWPLVLPTPEPSTKGIGGVAYDPSTRSLYLTQMLADQDGFAYRAMGHVFTVAGA